MDSCLTLRNELSKETHGLTKQEILLGRGTQVESSRVREPTLLTVLGFMVMGLVSRLSLARLLTQSPSSGTCLLQPRWMPVRRILGGGQTYGVSF